MTLQVESNRYLFNKYVSKERFCSYWHQINEIMILNPESILEIGIGDGLVSNYLKHKGLNIITMDIDEGLNPDYVGSVLSMPFSDKCFEVISCFEVLEHLPYDDFYKALNEIYRVSRRYVVISLPDATRAYPLYIKMPKIGKFRILVPVPRLKVLKHKFDGQHYWEIGKMSYPLHRIIDDIKKCAFQLVKCYRVFEMPYHRFFILEKVRR